MVICGIDPGYATVGVAFLKYERNKFTFLEAGAIVTKPETSYFARIEEIYDNLAKLLEKHKPDVCAIEQLFFNTNTTTAIKVAESRGTMILAMQKAKIPIYEYTPLQVKQAVTGYGKATKAQVMEMTKILLNLNEIPKPDDAADACAVAITQAHCGTSLLGKI